MKKYEDIFSHISYTKWNVFFIKRALAKICEEYNDEEYDMLNRVGFFDSTKQDTELVLKDRNAFYEFSEYEQFKILFMFLVLTSEPSYAKLIRWYRLDNDMQIILKDSEKIKRLKSNKAPMENEYLVDEEKRGSYKRFL